jgi:phage-related protein
VDKGQKGKESLEKSKEKMRKEPQKIPGSVNSSSIIEKIDSIRAGSSLKDEKVVSNLKNYIFSLTDSQKKSLYLYLDSLARIIFAGQDSSEVSIPSESSSKKSSVTKKPSKIGQAGLPVVTVKK